MSLFGNRWLLAVVTASIALQVLSHHSDAFGRFLRISPMSFADAAILFVLGAIPLLVLEIVKAVQRRR
jgi:hypothetical protein